MRFYFALPVAFSLATLLPAATTVLRYDTRDSFDVATAGRATIDFEDVRNTCVTLADVSTGTTIHNVFFIGGLGRGIGNAPCLPAMARWKGYFLDARLYHRNDAPAQEWQIARVPASTFAVGFDLGLQGRPTTPSTTPAEVAVVTDDGAEQRFTFTAKTTPASSGPDLVEPIFAGFVATRPITEVRIRAIDLIDSTLYLDNFATGQWGPPSIRTVDGVVNSGSFLPQVSPNAWVTAFGHLLSTSARTWAASDFNGQNLPAKLDDVSVTVGGKATYVSWASEDQVNFLTPPDLPEGPAPVVITRSGLSSAPFTVQVQRIAPALFMFYPAGGKYAAVSRPDGSLVGDPSLYPGATTPARPGEVVVYWGNAFGRTDPAIPNGTVVGSPGQLIAKPLATMGGATADVQYAGLVAPGLYQFNVRVPDGIPDGDQPVVIQLEGASTQANAFITVRK